MDAQSLLNILESSDDETQEETRPAPSDKNDSKIDVPLAKGRQKKSLGNLAIRFADLLKNTPDGVMHINKVVGTFLFLCFLNSQIFKMLCK